MLLLNGTGWCMHTVNFIDSMETFGGSELEVIILNSDSITLPDACWDTRSI